MSKAASDTVSTVELNGQSVNSEVVEKSDQDEDSSDNHHIGQQFSLLTKHLMMFKHCEFDGICQQ